jgi:two-component system CheB/CheR fusion protein
LQGAHGDPHAIAANYTLSQAIGVYDALLDQHMPPSLLVNERRELVHAFGGAGRFLKIKDGRPSRDIWDMLGPDLKVAVTGAMQRALKEHTAVTYHGLNLSVGEEAERPHKLSVRPVVAPGASLNHLLVTIEQVDLPPRPSPLEAEVDFSQISRDELRSLEAELRRTKESLQATIEELETSNEELQAANEELLASNEELQSTNEELQSVNEELYTVNSEYQRKIAELTQLTNDMDNLLASIEVGTIFLDQQLCIRKFTPLVAEAFNLLPQDIGRPIAGFSTSLNHPRLLEDLVEVLRSERPIEREVCDRMGKWFFLRILPYKARGSACGVVLTLIDINGLKAAEDAVFHERYLLNSLMDSVPDSIYFKDTAGRFVRINNVTASRLGLESPAEAVGKAAADILGGEVGRTFDHLDARALAGEVQPYEQEQVLNQDGRVSWFMTTRQPLLDRESKVVGMFGVARDVTDQKRAEDEIRLAVTRRDQFLAMLSHELRNPLAAIVNAAMLLHQEGIAAKPSSKGLNVIQRQSRQMTRLLDDLLEVSRITQNKIELRRQVIDARSVASEAAAATRDKFSKRRVDLTLELDEEPVMVDADPARLQQILVNLLDNASKYNRAGGRAALFLRRDGGHAALRVWDDGAGIDPGSLGTIFEPFVQVRATLDRTDGGMGVGLTLVRSLVAMHGGTVEARSDGLGRGSEFVAKLPLVMALVEGPAVARPRVRWPTGKRVVVIEDNEDSCQTLQLLLESAGYEVFTAGDGKSGLALIERVQPDTALVDIGLPVMDGFELARRVRAQEKYRNLFLVALTGYGQAADQIAAVEAGFDEHVVKPMDPEELTRLMRGGGRGGDA